MPTAEKQNTETKATFIRGLGLFDATMIGVGAMIGAGIFVLTGIAAGEAGPASILAFALNGFVTLLTAFAYAELASAIPRAGGGYSFVRMAFPGAVGFISGWMLWFAYTVACSLYALGFGGYFWELFHKYFPSVANFIFELIGQDLSVVLITLLIAIFFVSLNIRGAAVTGKAENVLTISKIVVLGIFIFFGIAHIAGDPVTSTENLFPFFPKGMGGVLIAMGLTFIAFEGYDLIATVSEEIKNPEKNIPKATFISLGITIVIYLLILFVSLAAINPVGQTSWEFLGEYQETAIVRAAEDFMPAIGVMIIVFGGLLSTTSALNATVMAASRVAFSMGRDLWLPKKVSKIHPVRRTPHIAIFITGVILILMAVFLPIETVGSAASLIFLLTFALVNLAVIALRRKHPEIPRRYKIPFYPVTPILGFALNIFLALYQFNFQPMAWFITAGWIGLGLLLYYAIFEKKAAAVEPQVLLPKAAAEYEEPEPSILVALHNPSTVEILLDVAMPVAHQRGNRIVVLSVVSVPTQMPIHEGMRFLHHKEPLITKAKKYAASKGFTIESDLVIAHKISDGILASVNQHNATGLIMGWKGYTNARDRVFGEIADKIIRLINCDLMLLKIGASNKFATCLLPTAGGPNAKLAAQVLGNIAHNSDMKLTAGFIVPEGSDELKKKEAENLIDQTIENIEVDINYQKEVFESNSIAGGIAKASRDFDLVAIGAAKEPFFKKMLFGEIPEKVARYSPASVLVVKKYEGVIKSMLKKALG